MLRLPAVSPAEAKNPLLLPLKVVSVVQRVGRLTRLPKESPGRVKSLAVVRRVDDRLTQVVRTSRMWSPVSSREQELQ